MKRINKYEEIIGNKLNSLPAPDVTALWSSMEDLLDKEMPQQEKRKRGVGAWWSTTNVMIAASLFIAVGSVYTLCHVDGKVPNKLTVAAVGNKVTANRAGEVSVTNDENRGDKSAALSTTLQADETVANSVVTNNADKTKGYSALAGSSETIAVLNTPDEEPAIPVATIENNGSPEVNSQPVLTVTGEEGKPQTETANGERDVTVNAIEHIAPAVVELPAVFEQPSLATRKSSVTGNTFEKKKKKAIYLDKGISAGLALNLPVALNKQVKNELDMNGKRNKWQDYIPSVYAQLHLSKKLFVQAEFQPVTAQYTPNFTLYNRIDELNPDEKEQKVVQLNKLYYASLPLSVHYKTPLKNVTVGLGVQYSKLQRVILQDKEYYHLIQAGGTFKVEERKNEVAVKDPEEVRTHTTGDVVDSVASAIRREDWRLLADVGYQYKGFSLGVRYTSGLGNYINSNFTNLPVKDRNKSLQLYFRFNLFDSRKK